MQSWYIYVIILRAGGLHASSIFDSSVLLQGSSDHGDHWTEINNLYISVEEIKIWFSKLQYERLAHFSVSHPQIRNVGALGY